MKSEVINLIKIIGFGIPEIVIKLETDTATFDSIELDIDNNIYLHMFNGGFDATIDWDAITKYDQRKIYNILSIIYN